ncbi:terminase small subunit [Streptococcus phage APCM01]|uniref:terminase small subunit n=1 Tax=Streptococcus phage APCM01 TaxID=1647391 RepID=UPI00067A5876|nr:terminase small subunit [Streptococcus phage APCM01]AKI28563.1 terminase small subunit [Streptococcus phage APCM01]
MAMYAPRFLTKYGQELWKIKYNDIKGTPAEKNIDVLQYIELYVMAVENIRRAYREIKSEDIQKKNKTENGISYVKNPALITLKDSQKQLRDAIEFLETHSNVSVDEEADINAFL